MLMRKGGRNMSAASQNFAYIFGAKKPGAKENVISKAEMRDIRKEMAQYLPKNTSSLPKDKK